MLRHDERKQQEGLQLEPRLFARLEEKQAGCVSMGISGRFSTRSSPSSRENTVYCP
jgi:hypothetical protein